MLLLLESLRTPDLYLRGFWYLSGCSFILHVFLSAVFLCVVTNKVFLILFCPLALTDVWCSSIGPWHSWHTLLGSWQLLFTVFDVSRCCLLSLLHVPWQGEQLLPGSQVHLTAPEKRWQLLEKWAGAGLAGRGKTDIYTHIKERNDLFFIALVTSRWDKVVILAWHG